MKKTYFLFGESAVYRYQTKGINSVVKAYEAGQISYTTFVWEDGKTTPQDLLLAYQGNNDFCIITEKEYNKL